MAPLIQPRRKLLTIRSVTELPCRGQTVAQVKEWIERANLSVGDRVVVRTGNGGMYDYYLTALVAVDHTPGRRIVLEPNGVFGASFLRDGRNCFHPKGQTRLIEPTPAVVQAATEGITYFHFGGSFYI